MRPRRLLLLALPALACASDPALERQYDALLKQQKELSQEMTQASARADQLFSDATAAERQTGSAVAAGAARCTNPKAAHRPAGPIAFGPVRFKYRERTVVYTEAGPVETPAFRCSQQSPSAR